MEDSIEIPYSPFTYQEEFHLDGHRFKCIVGGRRSGKSLSSLHEALVFCLTNPGSLTWWIAPTYSLAKEIGWNLICTLMETISPAVNTFSSHSLMIEFVNGARIYFKGSDNWNSLRGRGLDLVVIDEVAFCKPDVWNKAIRPALSDKKGKAIFCTTPNGRNWLWEFIDKNRPNKQWSFYHWPTTLNPLISEDDLQEAKSQLSSTDFRQEYLGEFVTRAGLVYEDFSNCNIRSVPTGLDTVNYSFYLGIDFGFANPTAIAFFAIAQDNVYLFDEIQVTRTPIDQISEMIQGKLLNYGLYKSDVVLFTDPAGNAEELSAGISPVDFLRRQGFDVRNKGSSISPGLALVRSFIKNAKGESRFFIDPKCNISIKTLYSYSYRTYLDQPTEEPLKDNVNDHMCDAIRYFFVNRFDTNKYITNNVIQFPWSKPQARQKMYMKRCDGISCRSIFPSRTPKGHAPFLCKECLLDARNN